MAAIEKAYDILFLGAAIFLALTIMLCLIRAILGPRLTDRLVAVNMISCKVVILFAVLAVEMDEHYLLDICLTYALISFLAIVVLSKVYTLSCERRQRRLNPYLEKATEGKEELQ